MLTAHQDIPGVDVFGSSKANFTLPCGYVDPAGIVHNEIFLKELSGVEDEILDSSDLLVGERLNQVIFNCTEKLGTVTDRDVLKAAISDTLAANQGLPITCQDRIAIMLFLRRLTLGDIYRFERRCPRCNEMAKNKALNLADIRISKITDPTKRRVEVNLPRSNKKAVLKVLAAGGEAKVSLLKPTQKDLKSCAILARLESLDGKPVIGSPGDLEAVKKLPQADRAYLINTYQVMEGDVDTDIQVECRNPMCGITFEFGIDIGSLFISSQGKKVTVTDLKWI